MSANHGKKRAHDQVDEDDKHTDIREALFHAELEADAEAEADIVNANDSHDTKTTTTSIETSTEPTTSTQDINDPTHPAHYSTDQLTTDLSLRKQLLSEWDQKQRQYDILLQQVAHAETSLPNKIKHAKGKITKAKNQYTKDPTPENQAAIDEAIQTLTSLEEQYKIASQHRTQEKQAFRKWFDPRQAWRKKWKEMEPQQQQAHKKQRRSPSPLRTRQTTLKREEEHQQKISAQQAEKYGIAAAKNELETEILERIFNQYGAVNKIKDKHKDKLALQWGLEQAQAAVRVAQMTEKIDHAQARLDRTEAEDRITGVQHALHNRRQKLEHDTAKQNVRSRIMAAWRAKGWLPPSERPVSEEVDAGTPSSTSSDAWRATSTDPHNHSSVSASFTDAASHKNKKNKNKRKHKNSQKDKHQHNNNTKHKKKKLKQHHTSNFQSQPPHSSNPPANHHEEDEEQPGAPIT